MNTHKLLLQQAVHERPAGESTDSTMRKQILADKRLRRRPPLRLLPPPGRTSRSLQQSCRSSLAAFCVRGDARRFRSSQLGVEELQHWLRLRVPLSTWSQQFIHCSTSWTRMEAEEGRQNWFSPQSQLVGGCSFSFYLILTLGKTLFSSRPPSPLLLLLINLHASHVKSCQQSGLIQLFCSRCYKSC